MEYKLIDIGADIQTRVPVTVTTKKNPRELLRASDITDAIGNKLEEFIKLAKHDGPNEQNLPQVASLPPSSNDWGNDFYVKSDMYALLSPLFERIVWSCIHSVVGDELD